MAFTRKEYKGACILCGSETIHWEEIPGPEDDPMDYSFSMNCPACESRNGGHASPRGVVPLSVGSHPAVRISEPLYIFLELTLDSRYSDPGWIRRCQIIRSRGLAERFEKFPEPASCSLRVGCAARSMMRF